MTQLMEIKSMSLENTATINVFHLSENVGLPVYIIQSLVASFKVDDTPSGCSPRKD